jgi:hypothetical protein
VGKFIQAFESNSYGLPKAGNKICHPFFKPAKLRLTGINNLSVTDVSLVQIPFFSMDKVDRMDI